MQKNSECGGKRSLWDVTVDDVKKYFLDNDSKNSRTAINTFSAFLQYRQFDGIWDLQHASNDAVRHEEALQAIQAAIARDPNQTLYAAERGKYLLEHDMTGTLPPLSASSSQETSLAKAEDLFKYAISRDPANPWYYYDLGRLSYHRGDCEKSVSLAIVPCPTLRQYQRARASA